MNIQEMIQNLDSALKSAQASLQAAEKWKELIAKEQGVDLANKKEKVTLKSNLEDTVDGDGKILHGVFDGRNMITEDGKEYPVPANYASKSKLVEGDTLKLIIKPTGEFIYKQIEAVPRKMVRGHVVLQDDEYKILIEKKMYGVLYASITFFRAKVGDEVVVILPQEGEAQWATLENVIPQSVAA